MKLINRTKHFANVYDGVLKADKMDMKGGKLSVELFLILLRPQAKLPFIGKYLRFL